MQMKHLAYAIVICAAMTASFLETADAWVPEQSFAETSNCLPVQWSTQPPDVSVDPDCVGSDSP
jgi:hypothetical protein